MESIVVGIAEGKTANRGQVLVSYALGSCVGICLYDKRSSLAGMAHIILPEKKTALRQANPYKFADEGIHELIVQLCRRGAEKTRLTAKIAGGAKMFATGSVEWEIGHNNVKAVKKALLAEGIPVIGEDTGKNYGRTIQFYADDGRLTVSTVRHETVVL